MLRLIAKINMVTSLTIFAGALVILVALFPILDRIYFRPCHYYPKAFIDCPVEK